MDPMARTFRPGLERSNMFIELFTEGMAGEVWRKKLPGIPNPAIWSMGNLAHRRAAMLELLTGKRTYDNDWVEFFKTHHEAPHTGCLSLIRRLLGQEKVIQEIEKRRFARDGI